MSVIKTLVSLPVLAWGLAGCTMWARTQRSRFEPLVNDTGRAMFRFRADTASIPTRRRARRPFPISTP
jgi:hypothetical protein